MKKRLLVFFLVAFVCFFTFPAFGVNYSAENNPQYNLNIRTYDLLGTGRKQLVDEHDPGNYGKTPPQLCTMVAGSQFPNIPNLYQIHEYDFDNNKPRADYVSIPDLLPDYSSLIGLSVMPGQNILVPNSGYDIGGGKQVMVLYASSDQITLRYAVQDDLSSAGYGIHILGINTDPNLLSAYNQANSQGRTSLPALSGGEIVGTAAGSEILVSVRDSGTFMDPRWRRDWWFRCEDTQGIPFQGGTTPAQPGQPGGVFPSCAPDKNPDSNDSRPYWPSCNACGAGPTTSSCSTSFNVFDEITYYKDDGSLCSIDGQHWIPSDANDTTGSWGGTITLNPKQTTIPFVGKKGEEDEIKYLADYFEGTNEYYRTYPAGSLYYLDWINYAGVNRKLLPVTVQDNLKEKMITRVKSSLNKTTTQNIVHDYKIGYNSRICWDFPVITDVVAALFVKVLKAANLPFNIAGNFDEVAKYTHYCLYGYDILSMDKVNIIYGYLSTFNALPQPFKIKYSYEPYWVAGPIQAPLPWAPLTGVTWINFETTIKAFFDPNTRPPKATDKDYVQKYQTWKEKDGGKWYRLWAVIPLTSREDSKGYIVPRLGAGEGDTLTIIQPDPKKDPTVDYVPHVERLSELGKMVLKTLVPSSTTVLGESTSSTTTAETQVLAETTTLAQGGGSFSLGLDLALPSGNTPGNYSIDAYASIASAPSGCDFLITDNLMHVSYSSGHGCEIVGRGANLDQNPVRINDLGNCSPPAIYMNIGSSYTINVVVDITNVGGSNCSGWNSPIGASCTMTLTQTGFISSCGAATPPVRPPICGLVQPKSVPVCNKSSLTDSNPNDTLCCTEVTAKLSAKESFANTDWSDCKIIVNGIEVRDPDCDTPLKKQVSRSIAVSLSQPYLKQIWDETANPKSGVFNLFRPASVPKFEPLDAASTIRYGYDGEDGSWDDVDPDSGTFYYPYLGGIQQAKNWLIKTLSPYPSVK